MMSSLPGTPPKRGSTIVTDPYHRHTGDVLREARQRRGLTLREVGQRSRGALKPTSVAGYERGERTISLARFCQLADLYETEPGRLVSEIVRRVRGESHVVLDLASLAPMEGPDVGAVATFVDVILALRGGERPGRVRLRRGDLQVLSAASGRSEDHLIDALGSALVPDPVPVDHVRKEAI